MSTYRRYQEARDTAWRALMRVEDPRLPVDAEALARQAGVEVHPFPGETEERLRRMIRLAGNGTCVSLRIRGQWHIFLRRDRLDDSRRRFSVAHELGHLFLCHGTRSLAPGVRAFDSRENQGDLIEDPDSLDDYAADIFAIRLLAPACLLHEMRVDQSGQIMALCGLPPRAAALRAERMALLNERDAFYNHPLERQVRDRFLPFLRKLQQDRAAPPVTPARAGLVSPVRVIAAGQGTPGIGDAPEPLTPEDADAVKNADAPHDAPPLAEPRSAPLPDAGEPESPAAIDTSESSDAPPAPVVMPEPPAAAGTQERSDASHALAAQEPPAAPEKRIGSWLAVLGLSLLAGGLIYLFFHNK